MNGAVSTKSKYQGCSLDEGDQWHQFRSGNLSIMAFSFVTFIPSLELTAWLFSSCSSYNTRSSTIHSHSQVRFMPTKLTNYSYTLKLLLKNILRQTTHCSKGRSPSPTPRLVQQPGNFAFSKSMPRKDLGSPSFKQLVSFLFFCLIYTD